jgi:hypothetical protein
MDTSKILSDLRAERERIDRAIAALEALTPTAAQTSRPVQQPQVAPVKAGGARGAMTPERRRKLSQAAKKRWAQRKQTAQPNASAKQTAAPKPTAAKQTAAKQGGKRTISAAGRRRIAEAAKKMWAERKKKAAKAA